MTSRHDTDQYFECIRSHWWYTLNEAWNADSLCAYYKICVTGIIIFLVPVL